jgi:hypothetical protein
MFIYQETKNTIVVSLIHYIPSEILPPHAMLPIVSSVFNKTLASSVNTDISLPTIAMEFKHVTIALL